ncbi:MAG TPA: hypothetical protein VGL61_17045 [Kofleriaceae bacterium]|jgi:hypothetical protein
MTRLFASLGILLALEAVAFADFTATDSPIAQFDPDDAVAPITAVEGPGIKIGEGTVLHPAFGLETGYTSNVFYSASNPTGAGVLRAIAQIGTGSMTGARLQPAGESEAAVEPGFQYRTSVRASYDALLSGDSVVRDTGGLGVGGTFHGVVNPTGTWTFGVDEDFSRIIRAANFETSENVNRDLNSFALNLLWHPTDRAIGGYAYYYNTLDIFEQNQGIYPDRLLNQVGVHPQWKIFPETQVFVDVSLGFDNGLGTTTKESSLPFVAVAGVQTLLTLNLTLAGQVGYTNGFYSGGPSFSAPTGGAQLGYRYSPFGRIQLNYNWVYADSINANYFRDEVISALWTQKIGPLVAEAQPELHFREYNGIATLIPGAANTRDDTIVSVVAGVHYSFRNWIAATLDYHFTDVSTDYRYPTTATGEPFNPSYVRHDILLGVRVAM